MARPLSISSSRFARRASVLVALLPFAVSTPARADLPDARPGSHAVKAKPAPKPLAQSLTGQAKADYDGAKLLYGDGDYAGALLKFQRAYDASQDPRLLWNIAACQKALRRYSKVIALLKRYTTDAAGVVTASEARDAQDLMVALEPFTAKLTVAVSEEGADVSVDGESIGSSPVSPFVVDIGERVVRVTKDGFAPFEKKIPVGGAEATVDVKLEKEIHAGHLAVHAPAGASVMLDDKPIGAGKVELDVPSGGHQLRIVATGMRPYQSEVVIQDRETRTVDVTLEPAELPKVRVAVGCGDDTPRSPDEGLIAYLDGNDVLSSVLVKKSWDPDRGENLVRYVEYPVSAGTHTLRLRIAGCKSLEQTITVDPTSGGGVEGALEVDRNILLKGPLGAPGLWRAGVALWMPGLFVPFNHAPDSYSGGIGSYGGFAIDGAIVTRWFTADLAFGFAKGSLTRTTFNSNYALPSSTSSDIVRGMLRLGPHFPFNLVAFGFGVDAGIEQLNVDQVRTGGIEPALGTWAELDVQPFCSFGFFVLGDANADFGSNQGSTNGGPSGYASFQLGATFQPSSACKKERGTVFGLRESRPATGH
jgi:hypothetical protein